VTCLTALICIAALAYLLRDEVSEERAGEVTPPDLVVHAISSAASMPVTIAACVYLGVRVVVILVAVFGPKDRAEQALAVLKVLRRDRTPK
jgi:hypothetical protein